MVVIGFSGKIKSGKTTISQAVATELQMPRASFGDFVRSVASDRSLDANDRGVLQRLGESLIEEGWFAFCSSVLNSANWQKGNSIVVDGIRHTSAIEAIKDVTDPLPFYLVYVDVEEKVRAARCEEGNLSTQSEFDRHSTEIDAKSILPSIADIVVDGTGLIDETVEKVAKFIRNQRQELS